VQSAEVSDQHQIGSFRVPDAEEKGFAVRRNRQAQVGRWLDAAQRLAPLVGEVIEPERMGAGLLAWPDVINPVLS
jgi:hypothetical protein